MTPQKRRAGVQNHGFASGSCRKVVMPLPASDVRQLVARLADRRAGRTEANVQSDLHMLLAAGPLDLGDDKLQDIILESPAGQRRRIDVEVGFTVFEVKRDLRTGKVRQDAVIQLTGYVASRAEAMQQRYVGVLTDGAEWHLYSLAGDELTLVSSLEVDPKSPDVDGLCLWLEGVLATDRENHAHPAGDHRPARCRQPRPRPGHL